MQLLLVLVCVIPAQYNRHSLLHRIAAGGVKLFFPLYYLGNVVGKVEVVKQGLYYYIKCRFNGNRKERYNLIARCQNGETDLGTCGIISDEVGIDRRVSVNSLQGEAQVFYLLVYDKSVTVCSVDILRPFNYLDKLERAVLKINNGYKVIIIQ